MIRPDRPLFEPWNRKSKIWGESKNIQQLMFASGRPQSSDLCDGMPIYAYSFMGGELILFVSGSWAWWYV